MAKQTVIVRTVAEAAQACADEVIAVISRAVAVQARASLVLAGGSTFTLTYRLLADASKDIDWSRVHLFFGDERAVGPDDDRSNFKMAQLAWFGVSPRPPVHRINGELGTEQAARAYIKDIETYFGAAEKRFDCVLLGIGKDGHTASMFPESMRQVLDSTELVLATPPEGDPRLPRITMNTSLLNAGRMVIVMACGIEKRPIVVALQHNRASQYPISAIAPDGDLLYIFDQAAAGCKV